VRPFSSTSYRRVLFSAALTVSPFFFIRVAGFFPPKLKFSTSERASEPDCAFAHVGDGASEKKRTQCVPSDKGGAYTTCERCNEVTAIFSSFRLTGIGIVVPGTPINSLVLSKPSELDGLKIFGLDQLQ